MVAVCGKGWGRRLSTPDINKNNTGGSLIWNRNLFYSFSKSDYCIEKVSLVHPHLGAQAAQVQAIIFVTKETTTPQRTVAVELVEFVYWGFLETLALIVRQDRMEGVAFNVREMDMVGRSKVLTRRWLDG